MNKKYNWAILGCGRIAGKFANDLKFLPHANLYAAASRNLQKAKGFASENGFEVAYGSYEEMVNDPKVAFNLALAHLLWGWLAPRGDPVPATTGTRPIAGAFNNPLVRVAKTVTVLGRTSI